MFIDKADEAAERINIRDNRHEYINERSLGISSDGADE